MLTCCLYEAFLVLLLLTLYMEATVCSVRELGCILTFISNTHEFRTKMRENYSPIYSNLMNKKQQQRSTLARRNPSLEASLEENVSTSSGRCLRLFARHLSMLLD